MQYSILGEGLLARAIPAAAPATATPWRLNIADNYGNPANRVTVYGNLLTTAAERNPRLVGATCTDLIDNVIYNYWRPVRQPAQRQPDRQHLPARPGAGRGRAQLQPARVALRQGHRLLLHPLHSTWTAGNRALGFGFATPSGDDAHRAPRQPGLPAVGPSQGATAAYARCCVAGPAIRSDQTARLLANVAHGTGTSYSGEGNPAESHLAVSHVDQAG